MSSAVFLVFTAFFAPNAHAATSGTPTPPVPSTGQGPLTPNRNPTLYGQEKQLLSFEYNNDVLKGKETIAVFEQHYLAFMHKWNLGGYQNLHKALTMTRNQSVASMQKALGVSPNTAYVSAVQFPEEQGNYCGDATISTTLVEDSFKWQGANWDYGWLSGLPAYQITYDPYTVSQPQNTALSNENQIAIRYLWNYDGPGGAGTYKNGGASNPGPMLNTLNDFVYGKGGSYQYITYASGGYLTYRQNLATDSAQGWDMAVGIQVPTNSVYLYGWPHDGITRDHWIASTYTPDGGWTSEIADPVYNAPGYGGWNVPAAHYDIDSTLVIVMMTPFGYIW